MDGLIVRYYDINDAGLSDSLQEIAQNVQIPIVNALDEKEHPCQVLADIMTLRQKYGEDYKKKKIVMSWGYSSHQKSPGVVNSFLLAASILGMNVTFARPRGFELADEFTTYSDQYSAISGANIEFCDDLSEACIDADAIYVKSYKAQDLTSVEDLRLRNSLREHWMISEEHFKRANDNAFFMNCMPFIRGEQVTASVADHPRSIIFDQAANRLHVQKAILENLFS
ncbi:Ornithine carbamoyltransferase [compost metagenome]